VGSESEDETMSRNFITNTLQEIQFLHDMVPEYVDRIANISQMREFDEFDVVFRDGQLAENLYLVMSGNVHVESPIGDGHYKHILTLGPGELAGWSSLLGECYTTRGTTPDSAWLLEISVKCLKEICQRDPEFGFEFMRRTTAALAKRLSTTRGQLLESQGHAVASSS
jgi:CRP-like cAMP-binding protein